MLAEAAVQALGIIMEPSRLVFVMLGTVLGLMIGVIPGIGGLVGLALLLPFTFAMDPYTALAFLVGVQSVTTTSDTIPAVLFGVPGTVGSAATVLDGHPMAKRGEAGRAYGAAFTASVLGGLFGALLLALSVPILRPFVLAVGTPELLAVCLLGLTLIVSLSQGALFKGLAAAAVGLLLSTVGDEPQTGIQRWTFDTFYLWDGISLVPLALGLFAVPEIIDLAASKRSISQTDTRTDRWQQLEGAKDVLRNWWLVIRCSSIGSILGSIPGLGSSIIDWVAYGYAARSVKGASETFGKGDVRGVIASESANNAKEGGALVPTLAFGVPGSASMALLLGAFLIHGIAPGPNMLGKDLDVTFTLIWTVALANILGAGICFAFAGQFAKIASIRAGLLVPLIFGLMLIGAYQGAQSFPDLLVLGLFGSIGWAMKRLSWPRPPLILAFVLGGLIENYLFISQLRYGYAWMLQPVPFVILCLIAIALGKPLYDRFRRPRLAEGTVDPLRPHATGGLLAADIVMWACAAFVFLYALVSSNRWDIEARMMPQAVAVAGLIAVGLFALFRYLRRIPPIADDPAAPGAQLIKEGLWLAGLIAGVALVGMIPAIVIYAFAYMVVAGRTALWRALLITVLFGAGLYFLFHMTLHIPWPHSVLGDLVPQLRRMTGRLI
ncbi:tripartite tricarboxylate transporter permease [Lutibaculum baratangense]|uniref:Tricarboxylate transport membrane protein TctA n=1 Tax=Lutibaculum baratangense AMV1 TaxID=631454 RepID=V4RLF5_9HYPH|nr:tripartite tricarboxylate transporter permease [Lutibaculum baratangense]ESR26149.1 Tricarboxylate transport membrane protein TctA [Lutibaculum baratangense AMV1]